MKYTSTRVVYLCLTVTSAFAFPNFRQETESYPEVQSFCNSFALKTVLQKQTSSGVEDVSGNPTSDVPNDYSYVTSGIPKEFSYTSSGLPEDFSIKGVFQDESRIKRSIPLESLLTDIDHSLLEYPTTEQLLSKIKSRIARVRNACVVNFIKDQDKETSDLMNKDRFSNNAIQEVLKQEISQPETIKRSNLVLNPTGWRKRRSGEIDDEDKMQEFLHNVRQLLQKRQRLEFNPTGW